MPVACWLPSRLCSCNSLLKRAACTLQAVLHYGEAIKAVMNEELGDGCVPVPALSACVFMFAALESLSTCTVATRAALLGHRLDSHAHACCCACGHKATAEQRVLVAHAEDSSWSCRCVFCALPRSIMSAIDMFATLDVIEGKQGEKRVCISLNGCMS